MQAQSNPKKAPLQTWEYPTRRWERIHVDFAGPFLGKMFLIAVDAYSKWCEVSIMTSSATSPTIEKLRCLFATHGLPEMLVSDNGPCFASDEFAVFVKRNGIQHTFTAPYHPSSNGQAERVVRTVKEAMKKLKDGGGSLETKMHRFLFTYRTTPHSTTGVSPAEMLFQRQLRTALHLLKPDVSRRVRGRQHVLESSSRVRTPMREFAVLDRVLLRNFGKGDKWVEGVVKMRLGAVSYEVETDAGSVSQRHVDQMLRIPSGSRTRSHEMWDEPAGESPEVDRGRSEVAESAIDESGEQAVWPFPAEMPHTDTAVSASPGF